MGYFENLKNAIEDGRNGKNEGLPTSLDRLDDYISIKKRMMITVFGSTGSGKSSFVNQAFVISPWEYSLVNNLPIKIILFSMERSIVFTHAKQLISKIFRDKGELIDMPVLLGWYKNKKLDMHEAKYVDAYQDYFERMEEDIDVYEGQKTPEEIEKILEKYAEDNGEFVTIDGKIKYVPDNEKEQVIVVVDHLGLLKNGKHGTKKASIDKCVENLQHFRDDYGYTIVNVSQVNRDLGKSNKEIFEPTLDFIRDSSTPADASDLILAIFDPIRYSTQDINYGDVNKFRCTRTGHKFFRNVSILKNTYGVDSMSIGLAFMGQTAIFKTLPKAKELNETWGNDELEKIFTYRYFR